MNGADRDARATERPRRQLPPLGPAPVLSDDAALSEASRCLFCYEAPCVSACPTRIDVPGFIRRISTGNLAGSARLILTANPLGGTCGEVCPVEALCEGACVRGAIDRPVAIGRLQRYAVEDHVRHGTPFFPAAPPTGRSVGVVGAGPAGLACAAELRRVGIDVTIYEADGDPGGLCTHGIVPWRMAPRTIEREIAEIRRAGATILPRTRVGRDVPATRLLATHDAVFIGIGLARSRRLGVPGEALDGVLDALDVLDAVASGRTTGLALGPRVGIIGGGSTAMDVAAAARRLGCADVTVFYRRSESEAPAHPHAIDLARALDVRLHWLSAPAEILGAGGRVSKVLFDEMRLGPEDASGRPRVDPVPGARFVVPLDTVIRAVGQEPDAEWLAELGIVDEQGGIAVDRESGRTPHPQIWAGGDLVDGGREVVHAVRAGVVAARSIAGVLGPRTTRAAAGGASASPGAPGVAATPGGPSATAEPAAGTEETRPAFSLAAEMAGIRSPNPFWLASGPPTNTGEMVARAFDAGWGGAVWKTVGEPIVNVSPRLGALRVDGTRIAGLSNIELISDRPIATNLAEIQEVKRRYPDRAVVVSLMVESTREAWHEIVRRVNDTGADGVELNFGCPHGMAERGMGAAVGQVPEYVRMITEWVKEVAAVPVLVKLTPNVADITVAARAARDGGADGISLINTINSLIGIELDTWRPVPSVRGMGTHGGYSGPAVKPIALNMVAACARDPGVGLPISGIGGVADWRDAVEFLLLGAATVQVCTAVLHHGYEVVEDLLDGLASYLAVRGLLRPADLTGRALGAITDWGHLDLAYGVAARIDATRCIHCNLCYRACRDGAHQAIDLRRANGTSEPWIVRERCVGCRLCEYVCPVTGCITMEETNERDAIRMDAGAPV